MNSSRTSDLDEGFGLVEVVVSMMLFAILAMAILPLALRATLLSGENRDAVGANALASGTLAEIRGTFPDEGANSCTAVTGIEATRVADTADTGLVVDTSVESCPGVYPAALTVTVDIRDEATPSLDDDGNPTDALVTMSTKIVVTAP
ncbi:hypothetical protein GCM10009808_20020 [Microbacterium sediminicola]|uniref:Prepilin-type N-terminal cleavage/methylation domain-containing protein n=1 Tax=Microbacterium sediminicola TaxID=415210 RepID=A0ABP4UGI4_9MICO